MALSFSPGTDFEDVADGLQAITLLRRGSDDTSIANALRREISQAVHASEDESKSATSFGHVKAGDVRWHFPISECPTTPREGDVILDADGTRWTILGVQAATLVDRWRCLSRNLRVYYGLDDTIDVLQAAWRKGRGGSMEVDHWDVWKAGIRARVQPIVSDIGDEHESRRVAKPVSIMIELDLEPEFDPNQQHRVRTSDGTIYKVTGYTGAEQVGVLPSIQAEESPWPLS